MKPKRSHNAFYRWTKRALYVIVALVILVILLRLSLMTKPVQQWVKGKLLAVANEQLTVQLDVDKLEGDLWREAMMTDIALTDQDTVAFVDSLYVQYDLLSYFGSVFRIKEVRITRPFLKLIQQGDQFNVSTWLRETGETAKDDTTGFPLEVGNISLSQGRIDAYISEIPKDSALLVRDLNIAGSLGLYEDDFRVSLAELSFRVEETRLNAPLAFQTKARVSNHLLSLEQLVMATGHTLIESSGRLNFADSTARLSVQAEPLGWNDLAAYVAESPVRHDLNVDLDVGGNLEHFNIGLNVSAHGIQNFETGVDIHWDSTMTVTGAWMQADELDLQTFLGDSTLPHIVNLNIKADGVMPVDDYQQANFQGVFSTGPVALSSYRLDKMLGTINLTPDRIKADLRVQQQSQQLQAEWAVDNIWDMQPSTSLQFQAVHINPSYWLDDPSYKGDLTLQGTLAGKGFYPDTSRWSYDIKVADSQLMQQKISRVNMTGQVSSNYLSNRLAIRIDKSEALLEAEAWDLQTLPRFTYRLTAQKFNLGVLQGMEGLNTAITASVWGEGQGNSLETLRLNSSVRIDSSAFNAEYIDRFMAQISVEDTVATVKEAELQSTVADGSLKGSIHLLQWYNPDNELNLNFHLKDLSVWAPLAGVEELAGEGTVKGRLYPGGNDKLKFTGEIDFGDLNYNNSFLADRVQGSIDASIVENPEYVLNLQLSAPVIASVRFQDMGLVTSGNITDEHAAGDFQLRFNSSSGEGEILHSGTYFAADDSMLIRTNHFELTTSLRKLALKQPFSVSIEGSSVTVDTMRLVSSDGALLELSAAYADSLNQQGHLRGNDLNLTIVQELLLGRSYVDGMLSGQLRINRSDTTVKALGDLLIEDLDYQGTQFDTLSLDLGISDMELRGGLEAIYKHRKLVEGRLNVPFRLGNPAEFDESFFEQPIEGSLRIDSVNLDRFRRLLNQVGLTDTKGVLALNSTLEGTVGNPEFYGSLSLKDALVSGVPTDSVTANLEYMHDDAKLLLDASVNSMQQTMAGIEAKVPFKINLKKFDVQLPGEADTVQVDIETNRFNLAAVNDFVDQRTIREVKGRLDGNVHISGPVSDLQVDGEMVLERGSFQSVQAGITVDDIRSVIQFGPDQLRLEEFRAQSGRGYLSAEGTIELAGLQAGEMALDIQAETFRAANTSEYNATINMDTRLTGTFASPSVSGEVSFISGFIELDNFGEKSVESVELDDTLATSMADTASVYDSLSLDMDVSFDRRFFIRNQQNLEMEIEMEGQVDLQKEVSEELQIFGTLSAADGYAKPLGKRFELEEGAVSFFGEPTNPELNVRTRYRPPQPEEEILIWYIIKGTVENPQFAYESQPEMGLENIISYTLFGQPFYALDSWKQAVASSGSNTTAADMALEVLLDRVETLATQRLGIDVVRIENTRVGNENGTAITTGWYLNPRVFFAIQNIITGSSPETGFLLEYLLKENLKLSIFQGNDTHEGIDLKWKFDY